MTSTHTCPMDTTADGGPTTRPAAGPGFTTTALPPEIMVKIILIDYYNLNVLNRVSKTWNAIVRRARVCRLIIAERTIVIKVCSRETVRWFPVLQRRYSSGDSYVAFIGQTCSCATGSCDLKQKRHIHIRAFGNCAKYIN